MKTGALKSDIAMTYNSFKLFDSLPYSSDRATSVYHLSSSRENKLSDKHFAAHDEFIKGFWE